MQITTDDGIIGIGGSGTRDGQLIRQHIAPQLIVQNPLATERHADLLRRVGGGWIVDMALCGIVAKAAGLPLRCSGGSTRIASVLTPDRFTRPGVGSV